MQISVHSFMDISSNFYRYQVHLFDSYTHISSIISLYTIQQGEQSETGGGLVYIYKCPALYSPTLLIPFIYDVTDSLHQVGAW